MTVFDERPDPPASRRRLWLFGLPVLAALLWIGLAGIPKTHGLRQSLHEFRGDVVADVGPNDSMASALRIRESLINHPAVKLTAKQGAQLVGLVSSPVSDLSQSEALDVLSLAQRANALSQGQAQEAQEATLTVLQHNPGPMVRLESARFLGHLGDPGGRAALALLQNDDDPKVRQAAALALARFPRPIE